MVQTALSYRALLKKVKCTSSLVADASTGLSGNTHAINILQELQAALTFHRELQPELVHGVFHN